MANDAVAGFSTLNINGTDYPLKGDPKCIQSGFKSEVIEGKTESLGITKTFMMAKVTDATIVYTSDVDIASLRGLEDADILIVLADGSKFNMSGACINGDLTLDTSNAEIDLGEIQGKEGYFIK
jgi:DeoR/GlpR family transcriptional regulator of sugar metabolism